MLFYIVFAVSIVFGIIAQKTNKYFYTLLIIVLLSLLVGLRDVTIGIDTHVYNDVLTLLDRGQFNPNMEKGFLLICYVALSIFRSHTGVFIFLSFVTNFCFITRLWTLRDKAPFSISLLVYLVIYYPETCNIVRQCLAVSIIFLATLLLEKKKYILFSIICLLTYFIHHTSVISFVLVPIFLFGEAGKENDKKVWFLILLPLFVFLFIVSFKDVAVSYFNDYNVSNSSLGLMNFYRLFAIAIVIITQKHMTLKTRILSEEDYFNIRVILIYVLGTILAFLGYYITTLTRLSLCFISFEMVFIPIAFKKAKTSTNYAVYLVVYSIMIGYFFITSSISGWSGLANVVFFK